MRTRIIAVLNQKGGVGKTTTCVNLGAALARRGKRVLLIDMDPQANMTVHLGADFRNLRKSTYSLLLGEHPLAAAVLPTDDPNLRYVPSTLALANAEIQLASAVGRELLLREAIEVWLEDDTAGEPTPRVDYVFIDCPPSLGILTMNALCAAGEVLLPIQCEFFALQGVAGILESLKAVQRLNRGLELSMVVPCMVDKRKTLARDVIEEVEKYFGRLVTKTRIRNNVKLAEAPSHGLTIFGYDASSNGAKDYESLAREVLGESIEEPAVAEAVAETTDAADVAETPKHGRRAAKPAETPEPVAVVEAPPEAAVEIPPAAADETPCAAEAVEPETVPVADVADVVEVAAETPPPAVEPETLPVVPDTATVAQTLATETPATETPTATAEVAVDEAPAAPTPDDAAACDAPPLDAVPHPMATPPVSCESDDAAPPSCCGGADVAPSAACEPAASECAAHCADEAAPETGAPADVTNCEVASSPDADANTVPNLDADAEAADLAEAIRRFQAATLTEASAEDAAIEETSQAAASLDAEVAAAAGRPEDAAPRPL